MKILFSIREYNKLCMLDQYGLLRLYGVYLKIKRRKGEYNISLFSLFNYYVEVWSDATNGKLVRIKAFSSYKKLDPFLKEIDLSVIYCLF